MTKQKDYINPNKNWQIQIASVLLKLKLISASTWADSTSAVSSSADSTSAVSSSTTSETWIQHSSLALKLQTPSLCLKNSYLA